MKQNLYLALVLPFVVFFWDSIAMYPLKLLVVFFHESSHAITTVATGGTVKELVVTQFQGGHVLSMGGSRFLTLSSGYLGSLIWGAVIYLVAVKTRKDRGAMLFLGCLIIGIALMFVRNTFGFGFSMATGVVMAVLGLKAGEQVNDFILRLIGMTSMIYAPLDIFSDTISRSHLRSDARMLAEEFGGTTIMWGGIWIVISLVIILMTIRWGMTQIPDGPNQSGQSDRPTL